MYKIFKTFLILMSLQACCENITFGMTKENFTTKQGFFVKTNNILQSKPQIEEMIDLTTKRVAKVFNLNIDDLYDYYLNNPYTIIYLPSDERIDNVAVGKTNFQFKTIKLISSHDDCVGETSLSHELMHLIGFFMGSSDHNHVFPPYWFHIVEWSNQNLIYKYCECSFNHGDCGY